MFLNYLDEKLLKRLPTELWMEIGKLLFNQLRMDTIRAFSMSKSRFTQRTFYIMSTTVIRQYNRVETFPWGIRIHGIYEKKFYVDKQKGIVFFQQE